MQQKTKENPEAENTGDGEMIIEVRDLAKRFGEVRAVEGVSFDVREGEIFGFLGPNGAGKTTTINMLTGLARPDAGTIRIADIDCIASPRGAQHLIGVVPDESNLYPELSGYENLCFCGAILFGIANACVPVIMAGFLVDVSQMAWGAFLAVFCVGLFSLSLWNIRRKWIM